MDKEEMNTGELPRITAVWWGRQVLLTLAGCFFLYFGIHILISAYSINDPFRFVMTFFASNLIILISLVLIVGFVYRMYRVFHGKEGDGSRGD